MARMIGTFEQPWCPICAGPSGMDCPEKATSKRARKAIEEREWRKEWREHEAESSTSG